MRTILRIGVLAALAPLAGACAAASAKTKPVEVPPLVMPPPPPRVIEPAPVPEPTTPEPVADLPPAPPASRPARPQPKETREQPKESKPAEPQPVQPPEAQPAPVPQPPTQLRTPATANDTQAENQIRSAIERGRSLLNSVNFAMLSDERKNSYNQAKMFFDQAESALKQGNYVFAQSIAGKGEALAHDLAGR